LKFEFFGQIFEKYSNAKFHKDPFTESRVVPRERTDGHDESNSLV